MKVSALVVLFAAHFLSNASYGDVVPNGTFTSSIPLELPPGTGGVAPKLALSFSSVSGNGMVGSGWSLSGLATISRVSDGRGIRYDGQDRYISPHGRLFKLEGKGYYLAENHNLVRYYAEGECGDGPCAWRVRHPDGSEQLFGATEDSRIEARLETKKKVRKPGAVRVWALNAKQDRFGNAYYVSYVEYPETGDYYPDTITYTAGNGADSFKTVEFGYGVAPDDEPKLRPDAWAKYQQNALVHQRFLLRWVSVKVGGELLKRYKLAYDVSTFSRLSRLTSVTIVGSDDKTMSAPHVLNWEDKPLRVDFTRKGDVGGLKDAKFDPNIAQIHTGDFTGDGKTDFLKTDVVGGFWLLKGRDQESFEFQELGGKNYDQGATLIIGDYDGDGISDVLKMQGTEPHWVGYGSAAGEFSYKTPFDALRYGGVKYLAAGDFNGDGRMDIFKFCAKGEPTWIAYGQADRSFKVVEDVIAGSCALWDDNAKVFNGDYNMDGRSDLLVISPRGEHFALMSVGDGFAIETKIEGLENLSYDPATDQLEVGDFNGDGISDLLNLNIKGDHWLVLARGDGTFRRPMSLGGLQDKVLAKGTAAIVVGDINGDSLADLVQLDSRGEYNWSVIADGNGAFTDIPISGIDGRFDPDWQVRIGDALGTGSSQFLFFLPTGGSELAFSPLRVQDALVGIKTLKGKHTAIEYKPSTAFPGLIQPGSESCAAGTAGLVGGHSLRRGQGREVCGVADASVRYLVDRVLTTNGHMGGANSAPRRYPTSATKLSADVTHAKTHSYSYKNARYFPGTISEYAQLGFEKLEKIDENTGVKTITTFFQNKPLQGHPALIQRYGGDGILHYEERIDYEVLQPIAGEPSIMAIKPSAKTITTFEGGEVSAVETQTFTYDDQGFLIENKVCTGEPQTYRQQCKVIQQEYLQDFPSGTLGLIAAKKITNSEGQIQSWQRFRYDGGQLSQEQRFYCPSAENCTADSGSWQTTREILAVDRFGNVTKERNIRGNVITTTFDQRFGNRVLRRENSLGLSAANEYDPLGRVVATIDANGHATRFRHDALGRVIEQVRPSGARIVTSYHDEGDGSKQRRVDTTYDGDDVVVVTTRYFDGFDLGYLTTTRDGATGKEVRQRQSVYWQDGKRHHRTSEKFFTGDTPLYSTKTYDRYDRLSETIGKDGLRTTTAYGKRGIEVTTVKGKTRATLNGYGLVTERVFADGRTLSYRYDANQNLVAVTTGTGKSITFAYDNLGRKTAMTDPTLGTIRYSYSPAGDVLREVDNKGVVTEYSYDVLGRMTTKKVGDAPATSYVYDEGTANCKGKLAKVTGAFGFKEFGYTAGGKIALTATRYENMGVTFTEKLSYDALDRVTEYTFPDGTVQSYSYNGLDQFRQIAVDSLPIARYDAYDAAGRVTAKTTLNDFRTAGAASERAFTTERIAYHPELDTISELVTTSHFGAGGAFGHAAAGRGGAAAGSGDAAGGRNAVSEPIGPDTVRDAIAGMMANDQRAGGSLNGRNAATGARQLQNIRYSYNEAAELAHITDQRENTKIPGKDGKEVDTAVSQSFRYDALGQLTAAEGLYGAKAFRYDQDGNITERQGRVWDRLSYNDANQLISNDEIEVRYDANGNLVLKKNKKSGESWQYSYDGENRLIAAFKNGAKVAEYRYNEQGRRYKKTTFKNDESTTTWFLSSGFELTTFGGRSGTVVTRHYYGADQQRIATETVASRSGIAAIVAPDYGAWAAQLAPFTLGKISVKASQAGQWLKGQLSVETLLFMLAALFLGLFGYFATTLRAHQSLNRLGAHMGLAYVLAAAGVAMASPAAYGQSRTDMAASAQQVFYHYDYLGSATVLTGSSAEELKRYVYTPFGEEQLAVGEGQSSIRYGGYKADDETGLLYAGARFYDAALGRFLTPDPTVPKDGADYLGLNRYAYVKNNPIHYTDPTGLSWFSDLWQRASRGVTKFVKNSVAALKKSVAEASQTFKVLATTIIDQGKKFLSRHKKAIFTWAVKTATAAVHAAVTSFAGPVAGGIVSGLFSGFVTGAGMTLMDGGSFKEALKVGIDQAIKSLPQGVMLAAVAAPGLQVGKIMAEQGAKITGQLSTPGELIKLLKLGVDTVVALAVDYSKALFTSVGDAVKGLSFIKALDDSVIAPGLGSKLVDKASQWLTNATQDLIRQSGVWLHQQIDGLFETGGDALAATRSIFDGVLTRRAPPGVFDARDAARLASRARGAQFRAQLVFF